MMGTIKNLLRTMEWNIKCLENGWELTDEGEMIDLFKRLLKETDDEEEQKIFEEVYLDDIQAYSNDLTETIEHIKNYLKEKFNIEIF